MKIGSYAVDSLNAGNFMLDGGSMYGVVPKIMWEKKTPSDEKNRIPMVMRTLLVRSRGLNLLVDTGAGEKEDPHFKNLYAMGPSLLENALAEHGLQPEKIDIVLNTHLHFDHAGGNTLRTGNGSIEAAFPNARYLVQRREFEDAMAANERNKASYFDYNYKSLYDSGQMELLDGEYEIAEGLRAFPLPGHTMGMQGLMVESGGETGLFPADCVPTSHHVALPWIMAYDLYPTVTLDTKKRILPKAAREGWTLFFQHDPETPAARIEETKPLRFKLLPLDLSRG